MPDGTAWGGGCMTELLHNEMLLAERSRREAFLNLNCPVRRASTALGCRTGYAGSFSRPLLA